MNVLTKILIFTLLLLSVNVFSQSVGGVTSGSASYCSGNNSGFVTLTGNTGSILFWQTSINAGATWTNVSNITTAQSYLNLIQTTHYRVVVKDGAFPEDTSTISVITIYTPSNGGILTGGGTFCDNATGVLTLSGYVGNVTNWLFSTNGGVSWTTIVNTTTSLNYISITQNTLYMAVLVNEPTCPSDSSSIATILIDQNTISGILTQDDTVCAFINEDTLTLLGNVGNILDWQFSTNNGSTWNNLGNTANTYIYSNLTTTTWYRCLVRNGVCLTYATTPVIITVNTPNPVNAGNDVSIVQFETTTLNGTGVGSISWYPTIGLSSPNSLITSANPNQTTTYYITLTDSNSCQSIDSVTVTVDIPVPNAISPNGDGINDFFVIDGIERFNANTIEIFNRYGNIVFSKSPYDNNFDGKSSSGGELPDGIYYYLLNFGVGYEPQTGYILIKR